MWGLKSNSTPLNMLPLNFELSFDNFHTVRECRVVWRQGDFVGIAFQN